MFHHNEIARAIRLLCQSAVSLKGDTSAGGDVSVGSNELFEVGDAVVLRDSASQEAHTIVGKTGLSIVQLSGDVGAFQVDRGARLQLATPRLDEVAWVGGNPQA